MTGALKRRLVVLLRRVVGDAWYNVIRHNNLRFKVGLGPLLLDLRHPTRFTEKVIRMKMDRDLSFAARLADKYRVREFVVQRAGADVLIPLLGVYKRPEDIVFSDLPERFVIKPNHGSGMIMLCDKAADFDERRVVERLREWLSIDYGVLAGEYQYSEIERRIVVEMDMRPMNGGSEIVDYKLFCFDGVPKFIQADFDRFSNHTRNMYDTEWKKLPFTIMFESLEKVVSPPVSLLKLLETARKLSAGIPFVRVDLYEVGGQVYFGEMTLHPGGGVEPFLPDSYDRIVGEYLGPVAGAGRLGPALQP